jgi:alkanesulfonate monooxygenase SsuD/methylene tetrahydromethanopterin reductase-like flavin-dependent oxidoreductase (luciferase family)
LHLGANLRPLGRNPFLLTKELPSLIRSSGGRLLLSFVTDSASPASISRSGSTARRGDVVEEVLGSLRRWWADKAVDHRSERWTFDHLAAVARPVEDPLAVWLRGRPPEALDRVGRIADGWLGAHLTPSEAQPARRRIQDAHSRRVRSRSRALRDEHPYARIAPGPRLLGPLAARHPDVDPLAFVRSAGSACGSSSEATSTRASEVRCATALPIASWEEEPGWLAEAILDMQT